MDYDKDFEDLAEYLGSKVNDTLAVPASKGLAYLKNVLLCTLVNVKAATLLHKNRIPNLDYDQQAWEEYVAHIRRSFLYDIWSTAEGYVREIAAAEDLRIKGQYKAVKNLLDKAIEKTNQDEVATLIQKANSEIDGDFVEFPRVFPKILDLAEISGTAKDEWIRFFNAIRQLRNATHNNFVLDKQIDIKTRWFEYKSDKGQALMLSCSHIKSIIDGFIEFYLLFADRYQSSWEAE